MASEIGRKANWLRRIVFALALVGLLAGLLYDLLHLRPSEAFTTTTNTTRGAHADVQLLIQRIVNNHLVSADVTTRVQHLNPNQDVSSMTLYLDPSVARRLRAIAAVRPFQEEGETPLSPNRYSAWIRHTWKDQALYVTSSTPEQYYPFDSVTVLLEPNACINAPQEDCTRTGAIRASISIEATLTDELRRTITTRWNGGTAEVRILRPWFLRLLFGYFIVLVIIFGTYLVRLQDAKEIMKDALGLLAAMWGFRDLLVPDDIKVFPTLVDYFVILSFSLVFLLVTYRITGGNK